MASVCIDVSRVAVSRAIVAVIMMAAICMLPYGACAAEKDKSQAQPPKQPVAAQPAPTGSAVNSITQGAVKAGVLGCASRINQVSNFLTGGVPDFGAIMFAPQTEPDQQMFSVSMELPIKDSPTTYASASFAPNQAGGCGGMYESVTYWPQGCGEVASKNFGALKKVMTLSKSVSVLDGGASMKIFLMPAATGCISIKKELIR